MKRLILMRHAKSDWSAGSADHDRALNPRGRHSAEALGAWLRDTHLRPDEVLCSSAERTGETLLRLGLDARTKTRFTRDLYLASHTRILDVMRGGHGDCLLMVGHNPGIAVAASQLVSAAPPHARFADYPTGATLVADFDITDWRDADWGKANARHFVVPRDL